MNRTPISILQELMVQKQKLPNYVIESCNDVLGAPFKCTVTIDRLRVHAYGSNKKEAKQNAAEEALKMLGVKIHQIDKVMAPLSNKAAAAIHPTSHRCALMNYVGKLNEYASTHGNPYPTYADNITTLNGEFVTYCEFLNLKTEGYGIKKKDSKQDAARKMLEKLRTEDISVTLTTTTIQKLNTDKAKRVNALGEILEKYENLMSLTNKKIDVNVKSVPNLKVKANTFEELEHELRKYNVKYSIETFQRVPCIMMMKIEGSNVTIMGTGETKIKALTDLYESALDMFSEGFIVLDSF